MKVLISENRSEVYPVLWAPASPDRSRFQEESPLPLPVSLPQPERRRQEQRRGQDRRRPPILPFPSLPPNAIPVLQNYKLDMKGYALLAACAEHAIDIRTCNSPDRGVLRRLKETFFVDYCDLTWEYRLAPTGRTILDCIALEILAAPQHSGPARLYLLRP